MVRDVVQSISTTVRLLARESLIWWQEVLYENDDGRGWAGQGGMRSGVVVLFGALWVGCGLGGTELCGGLDRVEVLRIEC